MLIMLMATVCSCKKISYIPVQFPVDGRIRYMVSIAWSVDGTLLETSAVLACYRPAFCVVVPGGDADEVREDE